MPSVSDLTPDAQVGFVVAIVCLAVAGISVALRFACKATLKGGYHADDWCILLTLATYWAAAGITIWGVFVGDVAGQQMSELEQEAMTNPTPELLAQIDSYLLALFWGVFFIWFAGYFVKISICLFYGRIFSIRRYRIVSQVIMLLSTGWIVSTQVSNIVTCLPVSSRWHIEEPRQCTVNFNTMYLATGIIETVLDAAVLAVPIRMVFLLQISLRKKLTLAGIFLLGGLAVVTDIVRLVFIYEPGSGDVNFEASAFWLNIHMALAILCACLPVYKPLWKGCGIMAGAVRHRVSSSMRLLRGSSGSPASRVYTGPTLAANSLGDESRSALKGGHYLELDKSATRTGDELYHYSSTETPPC